MAMQAHHTRVTISEFYLISSAETCVAWIKYYGINECQNREKKNHSQHCDTFIIPSNGYAFLLYTMKWHAPYQMVFSLIFPQ